MISLKEFGRWVCRCWRFFAALAIPLLLLRLVFLQDGEIIEGTVSRPSTKFRCAYVIIVMALYWGLEVIPLPVTSLLPLVMFPLLGVTDSYRVSESYTKESNMIFLGGVIVALGVEYCNLHRRIAIRVMMLVGTSPIRLLFGVMWSTALLSMWISATTCVALLVPLAIAIIDEIYDSPELNSEGAQGDVPTDLNLTSRRPSSSSARRYSALGQRRRSTIFENSALEGVNRRVSDSAHDHFRPPSPRDSIYPALKGYQSDPNLSVIIEDDIRRPRRLSDVFREGTSTKKSVGFSGKAVELMSGANSLSDFNDDYEAEEVVTEEEDLKEEKRRSDIKKMYLFAMAYSANIGGTAVITGTAPNKVFKEIIKSVDVDQDGKYMKMTFFVWVALNLPPMIINILITWIYLVLKYHDIPNWRTWPLISRFFKATETPHERNEKLEKWKSRVKSYLDKEYVTLGPMSFHETAVGGIFLGVVCLWCLRDPELFPGWSQILKGSKSGDSTAAMLGVILLFLCPRNWSFLFGSDKNAKYEALLDWKFVSTKMPWGVLLLLGSGFAIADASNYSGLSDWIGEELLLLDELCRPGLLLVVIIMTSLLTEVTSNVACANILLPIVLSVSESLKIHPLYLTVATAVTCSYAFLLPVAAPSNAIVFAAGNFSTMEMVKNGFFLNVICVAVLYVSTVTYGEWMFNFSDYKYPDSDNSEELLS